jgi:hypothetical protein
MIKVAGHRPIPPKMSHTSHLYFRTETSYDDDDDFCCPNFLSTRGWIPVFGASGARTTPFPIISRRTTVPSANRATDAKKRSRLRSCMKFHALVLND